MFLEIFHSQPEGQEINNRLERIKRVRGFREVKALEGFGIEY